MQAVPLLDTRQELAEGPAWHARAGCLHWVDIHAGRLHTYESRTASHHTWELGQPAGCVAPCQDGNLVLALHSGFFLLQLPGGALTPIASPPEPPGNRFNDGKCDPAGRFLAGSMDDGEQEASGSLYALNPDGVLQTLLTGLRISNGLTWNPDGNTFYFIDTPTRLVMAYDYDLANGAIANPRPVVRVPQALGWPDGMTSDSEGMLWIAMWGGAAVTRWDPHSGDLLASFPVPALNVTSCVFGGEDLDTLFITTARKGLTTARLDAYPLSGGIFCLKTGLQGLPTFEFGRSLK